MSNACTLYEGPYYDEWREQIALSISGRWFRRVRLRADGGWRRWKALDQAPTLMEMSDTVYGPSSTPVPPEDLKKLGEFVIGASINIVWRNPTKDECVNSIKGTTNALKLVPGPLRVRLPEQECERLARQERKQLAALQIGRRLVNVRRATL